MDEGSLEQSLALYEIQLLQVSATNAATEEDQRDLDKLQADLKLLIDLTKDNLLNVKKKRLLAELERFGPTTSDIVPSVEDKEESGDETEDALIGSRCRAPFSFHWGGLAYHNALITDVQMDLDEIKVKVMYCNPTCDQMRPCPYYLDGECRFGDHECRYSHGHLVKLAELREFKEPDFDRLLPGKKCHAKFKDGLWYGATVEDVVSAGRCRVKYDAYGDVVALAMEDLVPCDESSSSGTSEDEDFEESATARNDMDNDVEECVVPTKLWSSASNSVIGGWEIHTRGIGSKLMEKMGYIIGQGLGKNLQGRSEAIEAVVLPQGKSLDKIMELKERSGEKNPVKSAKKLRKKKRKELKKVTAGYRRGEAKRSVFDFLNSKLGQKKVDNFNGNISKSKVSKDVPKETINAATTSNLNVQSFQISEDLKKCERELVRLREALSRNDAKDRKVAEQLRTKICQQEVQIRNLHQVDEAIHKKRDTRNRNKKLSVF